MLRAAGFTLIELIGVIVIASVGMVGVARLFSNTNVALSRATTEQVLSQYVQDCAERVLETRRDYGFASVLLTTTICDPSPTSYTHTVGLPATYMGTTTTACPSGIVCRDVTVTVCTGSTSPCPTTASSATATLMLVTY